VSLLFSAFYVVRGFEKVEKLAPAAMGIRAE